MASPDGGMMTHRGTIDTIEEFVLFGRGKRELTRNESDAIDTILYNICKIIDEPVTRADWLTLAGKLRIVFDKDYPVE